MRIYSYNAWKWIYIVTHELYSFDWESMWWSCKFENRDARHWRQIFIEPHVPKAVRTDFRTEQNGTSTALEHWGRKKEGRSWCYALWQSINLQRRKFTKINATLACLFARSPACFAPNVHLLVRDVNICTLVLWATQAIDNVRVRAKQYKDLFSVNAFKQYMYTHIHTALVLKLLLLLGDKIMLVSYSLFSILNVCVRMKVCLHMIHI